MRRNQVTLLVVWYIKKMGPFNLVTHLSFYVMTTTVLNTREDNDTHSAKAKLRRSLLNSTSYSFSFSISPFLSQLSSPDSRSILLDLFFTGIYGLTPWGPEGLHLEHAMSLTCLSTLWLLRIVKTCWEIEADTLRMRYGIRCYLIFVFALQQNP